MLARQGMRQFAQTVRNASHGHHGPPAPVKFTGPQVPSSFVHDGWATARLPFHVTNKWMFATKAVTFLALGFWAPFLVVEYQLRKANSQ